MKQRFIFILLMAICGSAAAMPGLFTLSQSIHNHDKDYKQSQNGSELRIPKDLSASKINHRYDIRGDETPSASIAPPGSTLAEKPLAHQSAQINQHQLHKPDVSAREPQELLINADPKQSWSHILMGLKRQQMIVYRPMPEQSLILFVDTYPTFDRYTKDSPIYQLHVEPHEQQTLMYITSVSGKPILPATEKRLLNSLAAGIKGQTRFTGVISWLRKHVPVGIG